MNMNAKLAELVTIVHLSILCGLFFVSCQKDTPIQPHTNLEFDFSASDTSLVVGSKVVFKFISGNAMLIRKWIFPGGKPDSTTDISPEVVYYNIGEFDAILEIDSLGQSKRIKKKSYIHVKSRGSVQICIDMESPVLSSGGGQISLVSPFVKANGRTIVSRWGVGRTLRVRFLEGSTFVRTQVQRYAQVWSMWANIRFQFVENGDAEIRVGIKHAGDETSWSYIGIDALNIIDQSKPTMNFGWFDDDTRDEEFSRVVLHEFGHAVGWGHEHQSPASGIPWNKDAVYSYYERLGWTRDRVDRNIFAKYDSTLSMYSQYDPFSIMHYPISQEFTTGDFEVRLNTKLSATDEEYAGKWYPYHFQWDINVDGAGIFPVPLIGDYDGDGRADFSMKDGLGKLAWKIDFSENGLGNWDEVYDYADIVTESDFIAPAPADYDGDSKTDIAVFRGMLPRWVIDYASNGFGAPDEIVVKSLVPSLIENVAQVVPCDYDGDGKADIAIVKNDGEWAIDYALDGFALGGDRTFPNHSGSGYFAVPADYDGDGQTDIAARSDAGIWYIDYAKNGFNNWDAQNEGYGSPNIKPAPADYDGDGKADLSLKMGGDLHFGGPWLIDFAKDGYGIWNKAIQLGMEESLLKYTVFADFDGDGRADLGVFESRIPRGVLNVKYYRDDL
jgi:hypothetical protein